MLPCCPLNSTARADPWAARRKACSEQRLLEQKAVARASAASLWDFDGDASRITPKERRKKI